MRSFETTETTDGVGLLTNLQVRCLRLKLSGMLFVYLTPWSNSRDLFFQDGWLPGKIPHCPVRLRHAMDFQGVGSPLPRMKQKKAPDGFPSGAFGP